MRCHSCLLEWLKQEKGFPGGSDHKVSACSVGDSGLIPGWGRSPGEGNGNPLQYSCLENPMDRGACWGYSPWGTKSWTGLSDYQTKEGTIPSVSDNAKQPELITLQMVKAKWHSPFRKQGGSII